MSSKSVAYDILMVTDCRFPGGNTSSVVEEIRAQHRAGYRTGLFHLPSPVLGKPRPFAKKIREVLDEGLAALVVGAEEIESKLLLARHPTVFSAPPPGLPEFRADHVVLAVNQVPTDERGEFPYYDVPRVHEEIVKLLGKEAIWAPIGPRVRQALSEQPAEVPMLPWDWDNIIDVAQWQVPRDSFVADRPVIGRHSRGHWTKWPDTAADILAAYPDDPRYSVRILGGADAPADVLGGLPANWVDHPFNSIPAQEFLATIDFFVYFHHPGLIEAFGRVVLEALSAGAVSIVPPYLEPLFGDACLYGRPGDVRGYVDELYRDWDAFSARSKAGVELAERRFSYQTHVSRLAELIGPPETTEPAAAVVPPQRPRAVLVVDPSGDGSPSEVLDQVLKVAVAQGDTCTVAVAAGRAGLISPDVAVETFPRVLNDMPAAERHRYLATRLDGLIAGHRPHWVVVVDDGSDDDAAAVLAALSGSDAVTVRVARAETPGDATGDDPLAKHISGTLPEGWTVDTVAPGEAPAAKAKPGKQPPAPNWKGRLWVPGRVRRKIRARRKETLLRMVEDASALGLKIFEAADAPFSLPVSAAAVTHPRPERLPVALVVLTGEHVDAVAGVRAIVERQQITSTFRVALLAPFGWEQAAATYGMTAETLLTESAWNAHYGTGWGEYVRRRVRETCQVIQPETVVFAEQLAPGPGSLGMALEALEAARTRRPSERSRR